MNDKSKSLTSDILHVTKKKGTERAFTGKLTDCSLQGTYLCRQCGLALFRSQTKFHSGCGWPSFDEEIHSAVQSVPDADGRRTEILCARCHAHLGHVFTGEKFTSKNVRHCVNSLSLDFVEDLNVNDTQEAIFAAGCFWGVEYYFKKLSGILKTEVGYIGGTKQNPTYEDVCKKNTGHLEGLRVIFNAEVVSYESIVKYFFEIHDATQTNGQGPDIGPQYLSAIFYYDDEQKNTAQKTMHILKSLLGAGKEIATKLLPVSSFWPAEDYHQDYYTKTAKTPYCHVYRKIF